MVYKERVESIDKALMGIRLVSINMDVAKASFCDMVFIAFSPNKKGTLCSPVQISAPPSQKIS
jgi:hypothetical protein